MDANTSSSHSVSASTDSDNNDVNNPSSCSDTLIAKARNVKSAVWKYFGYKDQAAVKEEIVLCRICHRAVAARGGNTSNLISDLKTHHPLKHEEFRKLNAESQLSSSTRNKGSDGKSQVSIVDSIKATQKYDRNGKKWEKPTDAVTYCMEKICYQYIPLKSRAL